MKTVLVKPESLKIFIINWFSDGRDHSQGHFCMPSLNKNLILLKGIAAVGDRLRIELDEVTNVSGSKVYTIFEYDILEYDALTVLARLKDTFVEEAPIGVEG